MKLKENVKGTKQATLEDASKEVVLRHLSTFQDNNLEALMSDYSNESVLVTPDKTYKGIDEIKAFFIELFKHFPKQKSSFEVDTLVANDELIYILWHGKTPTLDVPFATDTFVIKEGKIYQQTFAGKMNSIG